MRPRRLSLARVMTSANEHANVTDQKSCGPGGGPARLELPTLTPHARGGRSLPERHADRGARRGGPARRPHSWRARRARKGAAAIAVPGDRTVGGGGAVDAQPASDGPAAGDLQSDRGGRQAAAGGAPAQGGMAGAEAGGADAGGADHPASGGADSGAAQPGLSLFRSLRNRNYRLFSAGQVISNSGTWMQRVAQDWLVLSLTHGSGTALGITTGLQFLPLLLFGLYGGVLAARFPKRRVLMITQAAMGALALVLGVLALTGTAQVWHVYALAFGRGVATVVDNPTRQTFAVEMVGPNDLSNAIALNSAIFNTARIVGPAIAGVLIAAIGTGPVFMVNAASFGAVLVGLRVMRDDELYTRSRVPRAKGQLREGLRYVRERRDLVMLLIIVFFVAAFGMNFQMTTALMSREVFHSGASSFGLASTMLAVGAVCGSLLAARRMRPRMRLMLIAAAFFGVLEIVSGVMPNYNLFLVTLVPTGLALLTFNTTANAVMQLSVPDWMRGRVMGLYMLVFAGSSPIGAPLLGWLAEVFGPRSGLVIGGVVSLAAVLGVVAVMAPRTALAALRPRSAKGLGAAE